jgi:hypothetical protein
MASWVRTFDCLAPNHRFGGCQLLPTVRSSLDTPGERSNSGFRLDLQHIALAGNHLVQDRIDEESDEEPGDEAGHNDDGERPLSI